MSLDDLESSGAIFGFEDLVALRFQILPRQSAKVSFILDQQDGFLPAIRTRQSKEFLCGCGFLLHIDTWKISAESCAPLGLTVHEDVTAALLHDAIHGGKTKARPLCTFRSEKRLKDAGLGFTIHADAGIADGEHDVLPRFEGSMSACKAIVERYV